MLNLGLLKARGQHVSKLFTKLSDDYPVCEVFAALNQESDVREFRFVSLVSQLSHETVGCADFRFEVEFRARIGIQLKHILKIILPVATTYDEQLGANQSHTVSGSHFRILFHVSEIVAVRPPTVQRIKSVKIVETLSVRT